MRGDYIPPGEHGEIRTTKIKAGKWRAECYARDSAGKLRRTQRMGTSESDATRKLLMSLSTNTVAGVKTVEDLLNKWLEQHVGISPSSRERYQDAIRRGLLHVWVTFDMASFWLAWKDDHHARKISRGVPRRRRTRRVEP